MLKKPLNYLALFGVLGGLGLSSCGEKESGGEAGGSGAGGETPAVADGGTSEAADGGTAEAPTPVVATATADERAKALGFAQYLPKDTEAFFGLYDGKGFVNDLRQSKLGKFVEARAAEEGVDLNEVNEAPEASMILSLFSEEFFVAVGKGAPKQVDNLVRVQSSMNFHQLKMVIAMLDSQLGGDDGIDEQDMAMGMVKGMLNDPKAGISILESVQMPPLMIGAKVSDEEQREGLAGMIADGLAEMQAELVGDGDEDGVAETISVKRGDSEFNGIRIIGEKVVKMLSERDKEEMVEVIGAANVERLLKIAASKNFVFAAGVHKEYVMVFAGSDIEELQIAESAGDSYAANGDLAFTDAHLGKLLAVTSVSQALTDGATKNSGGMLGSLAMGVKAGLADAKNFGDTQDIEVLLDLLVKQEKGLLDAVTYVATGIAVVRDEGLKVEFYGGNNGPAYDLKAPRKYSSIGEREGVLLFANWVTNEPYVDKVLEYVDTLGEIAYVAAGKVAGLDLDEPGLEEFRGQFGMFDSKIRPDLLELWTAVRGDLMAGLGGEGALVVDLQGGLPTVPGLPQVIVNKGKAPRIGFVKPVSDRAKISSSWSKINGAAENILKTISEMSGENIPMQKPMSSEKNDLQTWFFASIPFQTDDFVLSVSIDDQNFFASTSKSFVEDLSAALKAAKVDPKATGSILNIDFGVLRTYLMDWVTLIDENAEALPGGEDGAEDFRAELPKVREVIAATEDVESLSVRTWGERGSMRSTLHIKVK